MAISSSTRKAGPFIGNDVTTVFPFAFKVFTAADLRVVNTNALGVESDLLIDVDYTVSLNADQDNDPGGSVTRAAALPTGQRLTITSDVEALQPLVLTNNGGFYPRVINDAFDKITIIAQQLIEQVGRSLKLPISSTASPTLPDPVPNGLLAWNSAASGFVNVDPTNLVSVAGYADARIEVYEGDGTTTEFEIDFHPGVMANLDISLGGVTQIGGVDFTWLGTTVVFTEAPPDGVSILIRYARPLAPMPNFDSILTSVTEAEAARDEAVAATANKLNLNGDNVGGNAAALRGAVGLDDSETQGVVPGAATDQSADLAAYAASLGSFGTLHMRSGFAYANAALPSGQFNFKGEGIGRTELYPFDPNGAILTARSLNDWHYAEVADLSLTGLFGSVAGIGYQFGRTAYVDASDTAGYTSFSRVRFANLETGIRRMHGNLGVALTDVGMSSVDFGVYSTSHDTPQIMHGGCLFVDRGEFNTCRVAAFYFDSPLGGSGQVSIRGAITEGIPGHTVYVADWGGIGASPPIHLDMVWNEASNTDGSVTTPDGQTMAAKFFYGNNTTHVVVTRSPVGPIRLDGISNLRLVDCNTDQMTSLELSADSTAYIEGRNTDAQAGLGYSDIFTVSWDVISRATPALQAARMPNFVGFTTASAATVLLAEDGLSSFTVGGVPTEPRRDASARGGVSQEITLSGGSSVLGSFTMTAGKWFAIVLEMKRISGDGVDIVVTGNQGVGGFGPFALGRFETQVLAGKVSATVTSQGLYFFPTGSNVIRLGAVNVLEFDTAQGLAEFLKTRMLVKPAARSVDFYGSAAPTTGTWAVGDRTRNNTPAVGQPKSWVCTVAGTPGTWVSEGNL